MSVSAVEAVPMLGSLEIRGLGGFDGGGVDGFLGGSGACCVHADEGEERENLESRISKLRFSR